MQPYYWLILFALFLVIEILTLGLTTIWFSGIVSAAFIHPAVCGAVYQPQARENERG